MMKFDPPTGQPVARAPWTMAWLLAGVLGFAFCTWLAMTQAPAPVGVDWSNHTGLWHPVERNAFLRLPRTGPVHALTVSADGQRGWAIAGLDTLIATDDGGNTWAVRSHDALRATALAFSVDGRRGWALGPVMPHHTIDGGRHWTTLRDAAFPGTVWIALAFSANGQNGVMTGANGELAVTRDGGAHWARFPSNGAGTHAAVNAATWSSDGINGWVVGDGGQVRVTNDGGQNWRPVARDIARSADLVHVHFLPDGLHGWIVTREGAVFASVDGGYRWQPMPFANDRPVVDLGFSSNGRHGWAVTSRNMLIATEDGGLHWRQGAALGESPRIDFVLAQDGARLWVAGDWGIVASSDGGASVQAQVRDVLRRMESLAFAADGLKGWAVGAGGMVLHSADGGATWATQPTPSNVLLMGLAVHPNGRLLWAAGGGGTLLRSTDGGRHWTTSAIPGGGNLRRVAFQKDGLQGVLLGAYGDVWLSSDAGVHWRPARRGFTRQLVWELSVSTGGKDMWVTSVQGNLYHSGDAGDTWQQAAFSDFPGLFPQVAVDGGVTTTEGAGAPGQLAAPLGDVDTGALRLAQFAADGLQRWSTPIGTGGCPTLLTEDAGQHWAVVPVPEATRSPCQRPLAWFQGKGAAAWIARHDEPLLASDDGGRHWHAAWQPYRRLPAAWYWCALLPVAGCLSMAMRRGRHPRHDDSAAGMFVDDDAITTFDDDRLEFGPLARGLSRFLRNARTSPPLTLAIVGDWGTGKSSLMRLLCADLRRYGQRPIWFNAWHHQKDEQLFSALLGTIQAQAAPSSWRPAGWIFRLKLLWIRSKRHFFLSFMALMLVTSLFAFPFQHSIEELAHVLTWLGTIPELLTGTARSAGAGIALRHVGVLAQLAGLLTGARLLYMGMQSFGVNPALMFKGMSEHVSLRQAHAQNNFRTTFARQFDEVADALPYRMTIVVDDLDRCRAENILEVLETVNFLTASGRCFVVFGMARERVLVALCIAFEKIADELTELQGAPEHGAATARDRRRSYASDYLEKLINLEIMVPQRGEIGADALFARAPARTASLVMTACRTLGAAWPLWAAALAVGVGILIADTTLPDPESVPAMAVATTSAPGGTSAGAPAVATVPEQPAARINAPLLFAVFEAGETTPAGGRYGLPLLIGLLFLTALAVHGWLRLRAQAVEVRDSQAFKHGLAIWTELASLRRNTPRAIKRWGNRLRYFAMLQQGGRVEETRGQRLNRKLRARLRAAGMPRATWLGRVCRMLAGRQSEDPAPPTTRYTVIEEGRLVAIGAAHEAYGEAWMQRLDGAVMLPADDPLQRAMTRYLAITGADWVPISYDEAQAFSRLLAGIKLPPAAFESGQRQPPQDAPEQQSQSAPPRR